MSPLSEVSGHSLFLHWARRVQEGFATRRLVCASSATPTTNGGFINTPGVGYKMPHRTPWIGVRVSQVFVYLWALWKPNAGSPPPKDAKKKRALKGVGGGGELHGNRKDNIDCPD